MADKDNRILRFFTGRTRAPLAGVEVSDSTWAEWESVVAEEHPPTDKSAAASPSSGKEPRPGAESPERRAR